MCMCVCMCVRSSQDGSDVILSLSVSNGRGQETNKCSWRTSSTQAQITVKRFIGLIIRATSGHSSHVWFNQGAPNVPCLQTAFVNSQTGNGFLLLGLRCENKSDRNAFSGHSQVIKQMTVMLVLSLFYWIHYHATTMHMFLNGCTYWLCCFMFILHSLTFPIDINGQLSSALADFFRTPSDKSCTYYCVCETVWISFWPLTTRLWYSTIALCSDWHKWHPVDLCWVTRFTQVPRSNEPETGVYLCPKDGRDRTRPCLSLCIWAWLAWPGREGGRDGPLKTGIGAGPWQRRRESQTVKQKTPKR